MTSVYNYNTQHYSPGGYSSGHSLGYTTKKLRGWLEENDTTPWQFVSDLVDEAKEALLVALSDHLESSYLTRENLDDGLTVQIKRAKDDWNVTVKVECDKDSDVQNREYTEANFVTRVYWKGKKIEDGDINWTWKEGTLEDPTTNELDTLKDWIREHVKIPKRAGYRKECELA